MRLKSLCFLAAASLSASLPAAANPPNAGAEFGPSVKARMAKDRFVEGEPIGITLSIANPGPGTIKLPFAPPYPESFFVRDFDFARKDPFLSLQGEGTNRLSQRPPRHFMAASGPQGGGRTTTLRPGMTWAATIPLQANYLQPPRGKYEIPCRFKLPYIADGFDREETGRSKKQLATTHATLRFEVIPAKPGDLERILDGYWWRVQHSDPPEQIVLDRLNESLKIAYLEDHYGPLFRKIVYQLMVWVEGLSEQMEGLRVEGVGDLRAREAVAALAVVEDPVVIPYLVRLIRADSDSEGLDPEYGFGALERFHTNKIARDSVIELLGSPRHAERAREWLSSPESGLGIGELERILKQDR